MTSKLKKISQILFVVYLLAVICLCVLRFNSLPDIQKFIFGIPTDKVVHFLMFLPFPILANLSFCKPKHSFIGILLNSLLVLLSGTFIAALTEYVQGFLPYRSRDFSDFKADLIALLFGSLIVFVVSLSQRKKK